MDTTEKSQIGKNAVVLTIAKVVTLCISLVSGMLLARFRTLEEYGTYSQILIVITLASSLFTLGLPNSISFFLARAEKPEERRHFLSVYYTLNTILCFVMGAVLVVILPVAETYFENPNISSFAYVLAVLPWTLVTISSISNVLVVYGRTKKLMLISTVNALVALISVVLVQLMRWSFATYMLLYICGQTLVTLWIYGIVYKLEEFLRFNLDKALIKIILSYSIPIGLASLVGTISIELDKLMIGYFFDTASVAIYTNAGRELPLTIVSSSLTAVLLPQMARLLKQEEKEKALSLWGDSIQISYIIIAFCVTACLVFAPQIISLLYSEKYLPGVQVFRVYSLVLLLRVTYFGIVLNSVGKTKWIFYCSFLSLGINVLLSFVLFFALGFIGPAIATLLSIGIVGGLQLLVTAKTLQVSMREVFPWRALLRVTEINAGWGMAAFLIVRLLHIGTGWLGIAEAMGIGIGFTLAYSCIVRKDALYIWRRLNHG